MLLGGFLVLVAFEQRSGTRLFNQVRRSLDKRVRRIAFIIRHVDWGAFTRDMTRAGAERVLHDTAHAILRLVRSIERILTRAVKRLRERRGMPDLRDDSSEDDSRNPVVLHVMRMRDALLKTARQVARRTRR